MKNKKYLKHHLTCGHQHVQNYLVFVFRLEILLSKTLKRGQLVLPEDIQNMAEIENLNIDVMTAMSIATIQRALLGDIQAIQLIRDTIGEKPSDKVELDQSVTIEAWAKNHKVKL